MAYTTNRNVAAFVRPGEVRNGNSARGQVLENIANNHLYLAVQDCEMRTIYMGSVTARALYLTVRMNPYAAGVEFYFLCAKNISTAGTGQSGIRVVGFGPTDAAYATQIAAGEDLSLTGAPSLDINSYDWLLFRGIPTDTSFEVGPRALTVTPENYYHEANFTITVDANVYVSAIQFRVLPGRSPYEVP